jgi:uncharacterized protein (TIGR03085 family)
MSMTVSAAQRRRQLCDLLASLTIEQWTAETLCAGWDAADIAAHLIAREREPWTGPGLVLGGVFAELTDRRRAAWKARGREALLGALRAGPPWPLTIGPLEGTQVVEDWIHEQDVRRGGAGLSTPPPGAELERLLWAATRRFATRTLAVHSDVVIELTDGRRRRRLSARRRRPVATSTDAAPDVTITGTVAELLLYAVGRNGAEVVVTGDAAATSLLAASARAV